MKVKIIDFDNKKNIIIFENNIGYKMDKLNKDYEPIKGMVINIPLKYLFKL